LSKSPEERARIRKRLLFILVGILIAAVLWRVYVTFDTQVSLWESVASGVAVMIMGWCCVAVIYRARRSLTGLLNKIYFCIGNSIAAVNIYILIYYVERWHVLSIGTAHVEPLEPIWRSIRFILVIIFYCFFLWGANYFKELSEEYGFK